MRELVSRLRPYFAWAALFSLAINALLLVPPLYMLQVFDRAITSRSEETLLTLTVAALMALVAMALLDAVRMRLLGAAGMVLDRTLGPGVLDRLLRKSAGPEFAGSLRDVATLRAFFTGSGVLSLFDAPWLPIFLAIVFLFHPLLGAIALTGAATMCLLAWLNERFARVPLERAQVAARRAGRFIDAGSRNAEVVAALGMLPALTRRWTSLNDAVLAEQLAAGRVAARFSGGTRFARQVIQTAMLATGAWLVVHQEATSGVMIATTILLGRALAPVESLVAGWRSLVDARSAWRRLDELLGKTQPAEHTELPAPRGNLKVEAVTFGFAGGRAVVRNASFALAAGESLGIIGPSAAGKSTLARLLVGLWRPASGAVRLDGADVAAWPREKLGPHLGYLPQDVELFGGTVAENIARLGEPDAAAVIRAAQRAHVHELVLRLAKGYDTEVGEGGQSLSPGQRQRIALARALYGDPRLVILDEPNANLDHDGDQALVRTLAGLKEDGVTTIVIAHRPSLLAAADRILVLREGVVEAFGFRGEIMPKVTRAA
ncbi:MAG TPA: type I secretion system permease/ATPase [Caldimonas sp.]|jgi:PrtD family type I secretion system ABC transporter